MEGLLFLLCVVLGAVVVGLWITRRGLSRRVEELERQALAQGTPASAGDLQMLRQQVISLTKRVYELERLPARPTAGPVVPAMDAALPEPVEVGTPASQVELPAPVAEVAEGPIFTSPKPEGWTTVAWQEQQMAEAEAAAAARGNVLQAGPLPAPEAPAQAPPPSNGGIDWEDLLGSNLLAKAGALLFIIGIALFLGYWVPRMGPLGKVAVGYLTSAILLGAGLLLERRNAYLAPARALIAAGWAGTYFTSFAIHGLEAARLIESPVLGLLLLYAVGVGMTLFALRYGSQVVAGVTFTIAFLTLAIYAASTFSLLATLPLILFVALVSLRREWPYLAAYGAVLAYVSLLLQWYPEKGDGLAGMLVLFATFIAFESFDLLTALRRGKVLSALLFPLNALGFLTVGLLPDGPVGESGLTWFLFAASALFLASALIRARLIVADDEVTTWPFGFNAAITFSVVLLLWATERSFEGMTQAVLWLAIPQGVFLFGLLYRRFYLKLLSTLIFAPAIVLFLGTAPFGSSSGPHLFNNWTPVAALLIAALYWNRWRADGWRILTWYAYFPALWLCRAAVPHVDFVMLAATALVLLLAVAGLTTRFTELRWQGLVFGVLTGGLLTGLAFLPGSFDKGHLWQVAVAAALFVAQWALVNWRKDQHRDSLLHAFGIGLVAMSSSLGAAYALLPAFWVTPVWTLIAVMLIAAALYFQSPAQTLLGHMVQLPLLYRVSESDLWRSGQWMGIQHRAATLAIWAATLYWSAALSRAGGPQWVPAAYLWAGWVVALGAANTQFAAVGMTSVAWGAIILALLLVARRIPRRVLGYQALATAILLVLRAVAFDFDRPVSRLAAGALAVLMLFIAQRMAAEQDGDPLLKYARAVYAVCASVLLGALLWREVSGQQLTVAWGLAGGLVLVLGFVFRDRALRLCGLAGMLAGLLKFVLWDLWRLDVPMQIVSALGLSVLLIAASLVYSRYRARLKELL